MRELTYYVAVTIDGFIAAPDGDFGFFPLRGNHLTGLIKEFPETMPVHLRAALGLTDISARQFDTVLMGRRTYEPAARAGLTSAYPHLDQHVFSRTMREAPDPSVTLVNEDPVAYVRRLKQRSGLGIWLCGGSDLAGALLPELDQLILKVNPVLIGSGRPLFNRQFEVQQFTFMGTQAYDSGVVVQRYRRTQ
ncbi:dihydrofolate reductase family protein [Pilimelia columellifera]|uniref:Dihydrofolate reductase family protein n=1 Tax=Pilimelia columellifera subsp. columellifera TaxID=706583 RepID=A0ABP6B0N9_9ACTN